MKKDKFLEIFIKNELDDITVFLKEKNDKISYNILNVIDDEIVEIKGLNSKKYLKLFLECLEHKLYFKKINGIHKVKSEKLGWYTIVVDDSCCIDFISTFDNNYFDSLIEFIENKMQEDFKKCLDEFDNEEIEKVSIKECSDEDSMVKESKEFEYCISKTDDESICNICNLLEKSISDSKIKSLERKYYTDENRCYRINILLDNSKTIVIKGVKVIEKIEDKLNDIVMDEKKIKKLEMGNN